MAPRKDKRSRRSNRSRKKRIKPKVSSRTHTTAGVQSLHVKGTTLLSVSTVETSIYQRLTDVMLRDVGVTFSPLSRRRLFNIETAIHGVGGAFSIPLSVILRNSPQIPKRKVGMTSVLHTNYTACRLKHIRLTLTPSGPLHNRQGQWAMAFLPYTTVESRGYYEKNAEIPTLQDVLLIPGAAVGQATQELSVNYRAKNNEYCSLTHPLTTTIGLVLFSYSSVAKAGLQTTKVEDFGANIKVSGLVRMANPIPHVGARGYSCEITDCLTKKLIRVNQYSVTNGKCEVKNGKMYVSGDFSPITDTLYGVPREEGQLDGIATSNGGLPGLIGAV